MNLSDERLFPVFEAAERLGASVFVHPWDMMGEAKMQKYWLPWLVGMPAEVSLAICSMIFGGVFERLPRLRVAFAHGGGAFPGTLGRIDDFIVTLTQKDGSPRSIRRDGDTPKVEVHDPLQPHKDLFRVYADKDIHDVTAYLVTIK